MKSLTAGLWLQGKSEIVQKTENILGRAEVSHPCDDSFMRPIYGHIFDAAKSKPTGIKFLKTG